jgi:dihydroxyacetone kinase-like predicted kinase
MTNSEQDLRTLMAVAQNVAIAKAKLMPTTPDIQRRAAALVAFEHERIAQMRREELARRPSNVVSGAIREAIRKLARSETIAWLSQLGTQHPELQVGHRECDEMTDDDLRSALEDALSLTERAE